MPLYQYLVIRASNIEGRVQLDTMTDLAWAPDEKLIEERGAVVSEGMYPGTTLQGIMVYPVSFKKVFRRALRYAWINFRPRFK